MNYCENCGSNVFRGLCVNCDEEYYIADQYRELGMSIPEKLFENKTGGL